MFSPLLVRYRAVKTAANSSSSSSSSSSGGGGGGGGGGCSSSSSSVALPLLPVIYDLHTHLVLLAHNMSS